MTQQKKIYNKLVRDGRPGIIEATGKKTIWRVMDDIEYKERLDKKLREEVAEYLAENTVEELADIIEVIHACARLHGVTPDELEAIRSKKFQEQGGFYGKIYLESAEDQS